MADNASPGHEELGQVYTQAYAEKNFGLGKKIVVGDYAPTDRSAPLSGMEVEFTLVQNVSGGAVSSKTNMAWDTTGVGTLVSGAAGTTDIVAGVVDQYLGTTTVADDECFWLCTGGPHLVTSSASYSAGVTLAPAASGQTAASSSPPNAYDFAVAIEAATAGSQEKRAYIGMKV